MNSFLRAPLALALVSAWGLLVPAPTLASAATTVSISDCGVPKVAPTSLIISCADANRLITRISWTNWGQPVAVGRGILNWNTCTPTCVAGTYRHQGLTFRALKRTSSGKVRYTELQGPRGSFGTKGTTWTLTTPTAGS
jgi:hypothetical protein